MKRSVRAWTVVLHVPAWLIGYGCSASGQPPNHCEPMGGSWDIEETCATGSCVFKQNGCSYTADCSEPALRVAGVIRGTTLNFSSEQGAR